MTNSLIRNYDKISKGIQQLKNEEQNKSINILRNLTYISKINKNKTEINKIEQTLMKNLKLDFIDDNIKYKEYYFNGLPIPKDIKISDIKANSCNISWNIDDINILDFNKNKIKYKIELRKENGQFHSIYESNNMNYNIAILESNTNYEVRLCITYNNINSIIVQL